MIGITAVSLLGLLHGHRTILPFDALGFRFAGKTDRALLLVIPFILLSYRPHPSFYEQLFES